MGSGDEGGEGVLMVVGVVVVDMLVVRCDDPRCCWGLVVIMMR